MPSINNFLQGFTDGLPGMKDFRHASRLYLDDNFRLAPKNKFLYHVVFDINDVAMAPAMGAALLQNNEKIELNMLVKAIDLPKYNFNIDEKDLKNLENYCFLDTIDTVEDISFYPTVEVMTDINSLYFVYLDMGLKKKTKKNLITHKKTAKNWK